MICFRSPRRFSPRFTRRSGRSASPRNELADGLDDLFPVAETLQLLRFTETSEGDIRLADPGKRFVHADVDERKRLFSQHLLSYVPLAGHIKRVLDEMLDAQSPGKPFPRRTGRLHVRSLCRHDPARHHLRARYGGLRRGQWGV